MENYTGVIIEESLSSKDALTLVKIISTKVEQVVEKHRTPWLKQWTLHTVEIAESKAREIADIISRSIETAHNAWYADFKTETHHYIIYPNKVFYIDRTKKEQYDEASRYGVSLGIPDYQVNFNFEVKMKKK